ncbi:MAG: hypothetical protein AAB352_01985 [Patescibacteria group bacterium]
MTDENEIKKIEKSEVSPNEQKIEFFQEGEAASEGGEPRPNKFGREKKEKLFSEEQLIREQLEREAEIMKLDESLKKQAENEIKAIGSLGEEEKIKHLLDVAREKGLIFAIKLAKDMNDPYILDTFHDLLAKEGYYQKFTK